MMKTKVPDDIATKVLVAHAHRCCVCRGAKRVQLHHINGKNNDHRETNLAALCADHHDHAEQKGGLTRKLTPPQIRAFRDEWIEIAKSRHLDSQVGAPAPDGKRYLKLATRINDLAFIGWDEFVVDASSPRKLWPLDRLRKFNALGDFIARAFWPGTDLELERAIATFWSCYATAHSVWFQHCGPIGDHSDDWGAPKWYEPNIPNHDPSSRWEEWSRWDQSYASLLVDATGSANWMVSLVRTRYDDEFREDLGFLAPHREVVELPLVIQKLDAYGLMAWIEDRPHLSNPRKCEMSVDALMRLHTEEQPEPP